MRGEPYIVRAESGWGAPHDPSMGTDFAGTVEAVGRLLLLLAMKCLGPVMPHLRRHCAPRRTAAVVLKPANVSFEQAAAVPVAGVTALQALRDYGNCARPESADQWCRGRGSGTFCVDRQSHGAEVTAVTNTGALELVRSLGAAHVIDYSREGLSSQHPLRSDPGPPAPFSERLPMGRHGE